jgi:hypothetical protein
MNLSNGASSSQPPAARSFFFVLARRSEDFQLIKTLGRWSCPILFFEDVRDRDSDRGRYAKGLDPVSMHEAAPGGVVAGRYTGLFRSLHG